MFIVSFIIIDELIEGLSGGDAAENDIQNDSNSIVKPENDTQDQAMYNSFQDENNELFQFLATEEQIVIDDDLTMTIFNNEVPMPVKTTEKDLKKRIHDWLSVNLPFNDTVSKMFIVNLNIYCNNLIITETRWSYL